MIRNPARGPFEKWLPDPLPDAKDDADVTVTLKKLTFGSPMPYQQGGADQDDPLNKGVKATFHVERNNQTANNWQPAAIFTSDATGNQISGWPNTHTEGDDLVTTYQFGLWPDEPAWKIRLEFSKISGYSDDELWTVSNLPVQPGRQQDFWNYGRRNKSNTNSVPAETTLNGFHVKILSVQQFTDMSPNSQPQGGITIETTPSLPEGIRMTLVKLTDDQTNDIGNWNYGTSVNNGNTSYRYGLREMNGTTNINLTLAIHKSRFFEFTVKPDKDTTTSDSNQQ